MRILGFSARHRILGLANADQITANTLKPDKAIIFKPSTKKNVSVMNGVICRNDVFNETIRVEVL